MSVAAFVLAAMTSLAPGRDHSVNGAAIARAVDASLPLFAADETRMRTAALVTAIAFRESSFRNDVTSKTNDSCMMQVNRRPDLAADPEACVRVALTMLRESMRMCPAFPVAFYASGPGACSNVRAQRISRDRMALAARLVRDVAAAEVVKPAPTGLRTPSGAARGRWDLDPRDLLALNARQVST